MGAWFPKLYDSFMGPLEKRKFEEIRRRLIGQAYGNVLEIGAGTGVNFPYYGREQVAKVAAVEPDPYMRQRSLAKVEAAEVPIELAAAKAEELPYPDHSFDYVICTLVFCTIPDPQKALQEIRRVCKPDGQVLWFEHVRADHPFLAFLQEKLTPWWKKVCDGCHLDRPTLERVKEAGFRVTEVQWYFKRIFVTIEASNVK